MNKALKLATIFLIGMIIANLTYRGYLTLKYTIEAMDTISHNRYAAFQEGYE